MWDLKLTIITQVFSSSSNLLYPITYALCVIDPITNNGLVLTTVKFIYIFSQNLTVFFAIKFLISIMFLILIRGGTPRYRYDYLTKLGWLKFLGIVILVFILSLSVFFLF